MGIVETNDWESRTPLPLDFEADTRNHRGCAVRLNGFWEPKGRDVMAPEVTCAAAAGRLHRHAGSGCGPAPASASCCCPTLREPQCFCDTWCRRRWGTARGLFTLLGGRGRRHDGSAGVSPTAGEGCAGVSCMERHVPVRGRVQRGAGMRLWGATSSRGTMNAMGVADEIPTAPVPPEDLLYRLAANRTWLPGAAAERRSVRGPCRPAWRCSAGVPHPMGKRELVGHGGIGVLERHD